jgi:hypothetical protein
MFNEVRDNEFFDMQQKGFFDAGSVDANALILSAFGQEQFERLVEQLPAKDQVLIRMMANGNAETAPADVKALMQ